MPVTVVARRTGAGGSAVIPVATRKMAIVGSSRGALTLITAEPVVASGDTDTLTGATEVRSFVQVSNVTGTTTEVYREGIDFTLSGAATIDWTDAPALPAPELETVTTAATTGGDWALLDDGSIDFQVTAIDQQGTGETLVSNTQSFDMVANPPSGELATISLQWGKVPFAGGYNIYMTVDTGGTAILKTTVVGANTVTASITGFTGASELGTLPVTSTATRRPGFTGQTYYVSYYYPAYSYTKAEFTNYSAFQAVHGVGSNLSNAAKTAFDNGASYVMGVAVSAETIGAYQAAIDQLKTEDVQYVVVLKGGTAIEQYLRAHVEWASGDSVGKERYGVCSPVSSTTLADLTATWAVSFGGAKRMILPVPNKLGYYINSWQGTDGNFVEGPYQVAHYFYAAAVAGRICGLPDSATPLTNSLLNGWSWPTTDLLWVDSEVRDTLENAGLTYVMSKGGTPVVYHGITNDTSTVENQEISVGAAEDEMRTKLRTAMEGFRGRARKITQARLDAIAQRTDQVLGSLVKGAIIQEYGTITVEQDEDLPTKIWIRFNYTPIYPINEIVFEYGFASAPLSAAA